MAGVTKLSISLPVELVAGLRAEAAERGLPLSQIIGEHLDAQSRASRFRGRLVETYGPITAEDYRAAEELLATAKTPQEILAAAKTEPSRRR